MTAQNVPGGDDPLQRASQDVQSSYRSQRVTYTDPDGRIDDTVTESHLKPHLSRALTVLTVALVGASFVCCCFFPRVGALGMPGVAVMLLNLALLVCLISLFIPLRESIAEYAMLIEGKAGAASSAYGHMLQSASMRATPFQLSPVRMEGQYMLSINSPGNRSLQSLIVVRQYGADLYFGWNMWRSRSTILMLGHLCRDMFRLFRGGPEFRAALRGSDARALREFTHSVTRLASALR
ncbi:hypothetical protein [Actinoplanes xinjiangensis]|uniref:hypothetical protein n=1 Tax=Actinoplanes xinjiangensis TaxID=512350 RepID=UPI00342CC641